MLSIIICTYNRDKYIYNVLKSIADTDFDKKNYEIILINNNSTDNTKLECNRFGHDFPSVEFYYFFEENQGLSYARNRGIKEAKGEILIYVDDDALVNKEYLQAYYDFFENYPNAFAAGGPIIPKYETKQPSWMSYYTKELITGYLYKGNTVSEFKQRRYPGGGNAGYRKTVFDQIGFFDVKLGRKGNNLVGAEEKDIFDKMTKKGMSYYYIPNAILYHIIPKTKLTKDYFNRLTHSIGKSENIRTLNISKSKFLKRLILECINWGASLILCIAYVFLLSPQKGFKLLAFRWNVTKGLLGK